MENYAKVVMYAYPMLKTIGKEYQIHIQNRAVLSYRNQAPTQALAEYLASEIVCKQRLEWLKTAIESVLDKLDETERFLLAMRYFGGAKKRERLLKKENSAPCALEIGSWTESKYFRRQNRLSQKVEAMLKSAGVTKELFESTFAQMDIFSHITRFVNEGRDQGILKREKKWLEEKK